MLHIEEPVGEVPAEFDLVLTSDDYKAYWDGEDRILITYLDNVFDWLTRVPGEEWDSVETVAGVALTTLEGK